MTGIKETVTIQQPAPVDDDHGGAVNTWIDVAEIKAVLTTVGAGELARMDRQQMEFTHQLFIDYHKARTFKESLVPAGRVKIGDLYYRIVGIEHHFRRMTVVSLRLAV